MAGSTTRSEMKHALYIANTILVIACCSNGLTVRSTEIYLVYVRRIGD